MKKTVLAAVLCAALWSCSNENGSSSESTETAVVTEFLQDVSSLEGQTKPIQTFVTEAEEAADKTMFVNKANIKEVLDAAKEYAHLVIVTGNHTIVSIDQEGLENCRQSGSWGACMPYAEGYIKKGDLVFQADYINNIIGIPDGQERTAYFFN
ncbi:MAG: hypothetical protein CL843_18280 [Crocinitomicaceae bacterium]|nr:hypothetical protein [Crocinitomicaceae bacterium]|tara:strand:- start:1986 stop:2444 length:459 start_codon:yes stop_codon:yes gene_type:complete